MAGIYASVGKGGVNATADVTLVQRLLNTLVELMGLAPLEADGDCGDLTIEAIRAFQFRFLGMVRPDGRIDPGGRSWTRLVAEGADDSAVQPLPASRLSGADWWHANQARFANSADLDDLVEPFRGKARIFIKALRDAGANVRISATRRNPTRAWLMHHCYRIAKKQEAPGAVPPNPACDIIWDHGTPAASRAAAQDMADLFGIAYLPSLNSRHIEGKAIDITIGWSGTLSIPDGTGKLQQIGAPRDGSNTALHKLGRSYGVVKLVSDPPHWSSDGH
ncbi:peptidoglycan-binding domain-containing protein [Sphingobium sp. H39-3-25]|uniref:peptidoglycan-binding domain-containing protein n=1 Tax=Sphingobium arseniciresistens TaxID=3030834 RepID=UPI0023B8DD41|nr:peptidoglycan-binding domain-containing protein [Sphingobium arseniciresistens]